jgi:hypothetical protein
VHASTGWYLDPSQPGIERYWDGSQWLYERPVFSDPAQSTVGFELPSHEALAQLDQSDAVAAGDPTETGHSTKNARKAATRRRTLRALSVVVGAAVVATGSLIIVGRHGDAADGAVVGAVNSSLAGQSADLTLTGSGSAAGSSFSMTGTGSIDFAQGTMQASVDVTHGSQQLSGQVIEVNNMIYVNLGSVIGQLDPGKSWVSMSPSQFSSGSGTSSLGSVNTLGSDPAAGLQSLRQGGNAATSLGSSTVDGQSVEGYSVHLTSPDRDYQVYVDNAGRLVRVVMDVNDTLAGQSVSEIDTFDFSNYGTPVNVTAPPAAEVAPFQSFLKAAMALSSPSGQLD